MFEVPDRVEMKSARWVTLGLHGLFLVLLVVAVVRTSTVAAFVSGGVIATWYFVGMVVRRTRSSSLAAVWVGGLGIAWAAATLAVAPDFAWLAFPLFFLFLFLVPTPASVIAVAVTTLVAIIGLDADGQLDLGEILGPVIGAGVAVVFALAYRALITEHHRTRQLLAELVETRGLLAAAEREKGALEERRRIAREVHDTIAQGLSSIVLLAHAAALSESTHDTNIEQIGEIAQENLDEARRIVMALSPHDLDGTSLSGAIERAAKHSGDVTGIQVDTTIVGDPARLPVLHELTLLRVVQGALANATSHAEAQHIQVTLSFLDDRTTIDVVDDGKGFNPAEIPMDPVTSTGFGLSVMRHRLDEVGGTLTIESAPGEGTAVVASIPWEQP